VTWAVPDWWTVALLALAAFRVFHLLAFDTILDSIRHRLVKAESPQEEFLQCPWCTGFWVTLAWFLASEAWPHGSLVVAAPFAISAVLALVASHSEE
jgi:hypothetical protein